MLSKRNNHSRSRSRSPERKRQRYGDANVDEISENDYFLKMNEFQSWLKQEKDKYFDELSGEKARHYFRKFVKKWNHGELSSELYHGLSVPNTAQTSYKWSFAKNKSKVDENALRTAREDVDKATYGNTASSGPSASRSSLVKGPSMPSSSDIQLAKEQEEDYANATRQYERRKDRTEFRDRVEDQVGPKEAGREGQLEKKRAQRDSDRAYRNAKEDGDIEFRDADLMGGGDSFRATVARRDANRRKFEEKKRLERESRQAGVIERTSAMREKDKATMDMFKAMAKERFG